MSIAARLYYFFKKKKKKRIWYSPAQAPCAPRGKQVEPNGYSIFKKQLKENWV